MAGSPRAGFFITAILAVLAPLAVAAHAPASDPGPAAAPAAAAPVLRFSSQSAPTAFGLIPGTDNRRFTYLDFGESRGDKALRTFRLALDDIPGEVGQILSFPFRKPRDTALFALGVTALISVDRQTTAFWQDKVEPAFDGFGASSPLYPGLTSLGISTESQYLLTGLGLSYAGGIAFNDERSQTAALLSAKAIGYSYLTSQLILKPLFGRMRPIDDLSSGSGPSGDFTDDPWDFGNRDGIPWRGGAFGTAMPSFHFTQYFAVARVYAGIYDNNVAPYLAAGVLAASNIRGHHHWVSDMAAGAAIGIGIGNLVLNNYEDRKTGLDGATFMPVVSSGSMGLTWSMEF